MELLMLSAGACAFAATITIDGTGELRFLPSNPNRTGPAMSSGIGWAESRTIGNVKAGPGVRQAAISLMMTFLT
jgi:hypothetical protein